MSTFLWESIAFGPIHSRRLGHSLGINLLPTDEKICSFDCLYCECGWTLEKNLKAREFYPVSTVLQAIEHKLKTCMESNTPVDSITFSGNGEPTLHPSFGEIICLYYRSPAAALQDGDGQKLCKNAHKAGHLT